MEQRDQLAFQSATESPAPRGRVGGLHVVICEDKYYKKVFSPRLFLFNMKFILKGRGKQTDMDVGIQHPQV